MAGQTFRFTSAELLATVLREIGMRQHVYRRNIEAGKMSQHKADYEIAAMQAVADLLERPEVRKLVDGPGLFDSKD